MARRLTRGRYQAARHVLYVCARIVAGVLRGDARIIVQMPPRHGKSELVSVWLVVWFLALFPHRLVLLASYGADLARQFAQRVRDIIDKHHELLGVRLSPGSRKAHDWQLSAGGGVLAGGVGGPFTGRGGDLVIIDDPFKNEQEAESQLYRDRVWAWWQATVYTRLEPGASVIIMHTRWHEDDLAGRLIRESELAAEQGEEADRWEVIDLPALARENDPLGRQTLPCPACGGTGQRTDTDRPDIGQCSACGGIGEIGEALWPERRTVSQLLRIKRAIGSYFFAALFQQAPAPPEGGIFPRAWWRYHTADPRAVDERTRTTPPTFDLVLQSWDMAFGESETSSYVVGEVWGLRGGDAFLLDQVRGQMEYPATKAAVRTLTAKWPSAELKLVENKANGPAIIADLARTIPGLVPVQPLGDKVARARANTGAMEAGNVYLPIDAPWLHDYIEEHALFPHGAHDDQVDATSQALARLLSIRPSQADSYATVKAH